MILPLATFVQFAASCGPTVHVDTLAAVARAESGFQTDAIHDNTDRRRYLPRSREEAVALATDLVVVRHHSVDLGLMQVNSANLAALGLTIADTFDACKSIGAGARVLTAAYSPPAAGQDAQPALRQALSRYNTGDPAKGLANGYVTRVQAAAEQVVPAIRLNGPAGAGQEETEQAAAPPPPSWDVFAQARFARDRAQVVDSAKAKTAPMQAPVLPAPLQPLQQPVPLRVSSNREAVDAR